eukprot:scaffold53962_cov56-Phaeocystis_antarctica.AAC.4
MPEAVEFCDAGLVVKPVLYTRRRRRRRRRRCNHAPVLLRAECKGVVVHEERRVRGEQAERACRGHLIGTGEVEPSEPRAGGRERGEPRVGEPAAAMRTQLGQPRQVEGDGVEGSVGELVASAQVEVCEGGAMESLHVQP